MEDITDSDYTNAKRAFKDFEINSLGEYCSSLFVQIEKLL